MRREKEEKIEEKMAASVARNTVITAELSVGHRCSREEDEGGRENWISN